MIFQVKDKNRYFQVLSSLPVAVVVADIETGIILHVNPPAEKLWKYDATTLIGKSQTVLHSDYWNDKSRETFSKDIETLRAGKMLTQSKNAALRADGSEIPITINAILVNLEGKEAIVGTFLSLEDEEKAYKELAQKEQELNTIFDNSQVGIAYLKNGRILHKANKKLANMLGYDANVDIEGLSIEDFHLSHEKFVWFGEHHYEALREKHATHINYQLRKKNGESIWVSLSGQAVDTAVPPDLSKGVIWVVDDIDDYMNLQQELVTQNSNLQKLLYNINGISWTFDLKNNKFTYVSSNSEKILGYTEQEWTDLDSWKMMLHPDDREEAAEYCANETHKGKDHLMEYRMLKKDGTVIWVLDIVSLGKDEDGNATMLYGFILDITKQKNDQLKIEQDKKRLQETLDELKNKNDLLDYQAHHDTLTGLPNRTLYHYMVEQAIQKTKKTEKKFALVFIDLDHFKEVNDSLGHEEGDIILVEASKRLKNCIKQEGKLARLGGDEFAILIEDINKVQDISHTAQDILEAFHKPFVIDKQDIYLSCSIGIALYPDDGVVSSELIKYADNAMFKAKDEGRDNFQFYKREMTELIFERMILESNLRQAITNDEFVLYYQPQYEATTKKIIGMEALVRWSHPAMGIIPPSKFIPLAEESSLIIDIDNWVMKTAMRQVKEWYDKGLNPGILSLNLAIKQLESRLFIEKLQRTMQETEFNPQWLKLEVLERDVMKKPQESIKKLTLLHKLGVKLSIDDFGTGQSSLTYLKRFPLDQLKIDQSFVRDIHSNEENDAIILLIAEGVETEEQLQFLVENNCSKIQGYYFSKPLSSDALEAALKNEFASKN